jgi:serine/threonine-protein kinase
MPIQVGDVFGDYQVTGVLGRGGMGKVYRVRSLVTDREEAMKVALSDVEADSALADRFLREIKIHASLQHPNIAALHTAMRIEGRLVMIVELVEGSSLEEKLRHGPFEIPAAIHCVLQVLAALGFAHDRGVIHRDIKPANILITAGGVVKLTDFGIARSSGAARLTGTGLAVGTLAYMSPEQIRSGMVDVRSDIYSLGLTFYEMVAGRRAIQADTEHALMNAQLDEIPVEPSACNPLVTAAVSAAIMRALAKQPERRFQTAAEFAGALQAQPAHFQAPVATVVSQPELADLEARLSRALGPIARRLVPEAAQRYGSISEIRKALAAQIDDPAARQEFLKSAGTDSTVTMARVPSAAAFDGRTLEIYAQALAAHLGPISKVLVQRAARNARSIEDLQKKLAEEIPAAEDRRRFLDAIRSAL